MRALCVFRSKALNWDAIGAIGEVAAAITVIASLLFVGFQLRQNGAIEKANAQRDLLSQTADWMAMTASDPLIFEAVRECLVDYNSAERIVQDRFNSWAWGILFIIEQAVYMHRDGFINDSSYTGFERGILSVLNTNGGRQWWDLSSSIVSSDVGNHIQQRLDETEGTIPPWNEVMPQLAIQNTGNNNDA